MSEPVYKPRKRLRKGTRSCTECRRRKIKCIFPSEMPGSKCSACATHETDCVDQREKQELYSAHQASPGSTNGTPSTVVGTQIWGTAGLSPASNLTAHGPDKRAPFVSTLNEAELISRETTPEALNVQQLSFNLTQKEAHLQSREKLCRTLRSSLPNFDEILSMFAKNSSWWDGYVSKFESPIVLPDESLSNFARRVYTADNPISLAMLATAYARSSGTSNHLFQLVDQSILSDSTYLSTIDGLSCLTLLGKSYIDFGEPKKAWLLHRRGIAIAHVMGLSSKPSQVYPNGNGIWWSLYLTDRHTSLLLGLPYCIVDAHHGISVSERLADIGVRPYEFAQACGVVIGHFLDSILSDANGPSPENLVKLNNELNQIRESRSKSWWELPNSTLGRDEARDRLLHQATFFNISMYIHLPFLLRPDSQQSSFVCTEAAEKMLERVVRLHEGTRATRLFDCRTMDFMGFVGAAVLLIGRHEKNRVRVVKQLVGQFDDEVAATKSEAVAQYAETLRLLLRCSQHISSRDKEPFSIKLPYFGVILRNQGSGKTTSEYFDGRNGTGDVNASQVIESEAGHEIAGLDAGWGDSGNVDGFWEMLDLNNFAFDDVFPWLDQSTNFDL